jgi:hypothetical protein
MAFDSRVVSCHDLNSADPAENGLANFPILTLRAQLSG